MTRGIPSVSCECLERRKETASHSAGAAGMVATAHSTSHQDPAGNRGGLSEGGRNRDAVTGRLGRRAPAKPAIEVTTDFGAESTGLTASEME